MRKRLFVLGSLVVGLMMFASPAFACGGLIGPRGSVNLLRTTTFAGYHDGIEHYLTSFTFTGQGGGKFGSLVPLPGEPSKVERGGDWTLQRLQREVAPLTPGVARFAADSAVPAAAPAEVLLEVTIDALDITVLKGGAVAIGEWAADNGFQLPPDSPEVLRFYAERSPIFMAARFNAAAAAERGQLAGDGTPIHITIPTDRPWVPLRILGLGKSAQETVDADVFLLTDRKPAMLPAPIDQEGGALATDGLRLVRSERANDSLMNDLRDDKGGDWIPGRPMWFSYIEVRERAASLGYDLAIDATGAGRPSLRDAGFPVGVRQAVESATPLFELLSWTLIGALAMLVATRRFAPRAGRA
jgi:hypothetical protein